MMNIKFEASEGLKSLILESIRSLDEELINLLDESEWDDRVMDHLKKKVQRLDSEYADEIEQLNVHLHGVNNGGHSAVKKSFKQLSRCNMMELKNKFFEEYEDFLCELIFSSPRVLDFYMLLPNKNI